MRNRGNQKLLGPGALSDSGGNHSVSRVSPSGDTQIPIWQRPSLVDAAVAPERAKPAQQTLCALHLVLQPAAAHFPPPSPLSWARMACLLEVACWVSEGAD